MSDRAIVNLSDYRGSLLECLRMGAEAGVIPNLPYDAQFATDVLKAILEERTSNPLNAALRQPTENRVPEVVQRFVQLTIAYQQVETGQYDQFVMRDILRESVTQYLAEGLPHVAARIMAQSGIAPDQGLSLIRQITGLEINFTNPNESDESEEAYVNQVNDVICYIDDLDITFRFQDLLNKVLSSNPFECYHLKYMGTIALITRFGDYRILEWERLNNR